MEHHPATTSTAEIPSLVEHLRSEHAAGRTRPLEWRERQLRSLRAMFVDHERELVDALAADLGKPRFEGYITDVGFVVDEIDVALRNLGRWTRPERVRVPLKLAPAKASVVREPLGVVLVIAPWNYPIQLTVAPLAAALAAGNTVVVKPSEIAPACSAALARLLPRAVDPEAVAVVEGGVEETTTLLAERFDHIFYTGNGRVGRVVMRAAAEHLTPVTLELGGKSPTIVDREADLGAAARRIAFGKFLNAGQTCVAPDYVLVDRAVEGPFLDALADTVVDFFGVDPSQSPDYGRIVNEAHFRRIEKLLHDGRVVVGGQADEATRYVAPTVLADVEPDAPVMDEEIFGPVLPVLAVDAVGEAIAFVNERDKPLALYVFSENDEVVERTLRETASGGVGVNTTVLQTSLPGLPFGGVGESGTGAYHGRAGFETFSHRKSVLAKPARPDPALTYPPYPRWKQRLLRWFL